MGSPFGGGGNSVTVNIGGNAVQLQTAAQQASAALGNVGTAAQAAANTTGSAMRQAAAGFDQLTQSIKYLQQAQTALGASQVQGDAAFLNAATSAQDYGARLNLLTSYLQLFNAQQQQTGATAQQTGSSLDFNVFGRITGWLFSFNQLVDGARNLQAVLTQLGSTAFGVFNTLSFGVPQALISGVGMLQNLAAQAYSGLQQYGVPIGPQGVGEMFNLNKTTESTRVGWGYLFGSGGQLQRTGPYAGQIVDPSGTAASMMRWSSQESMNVPFTRQDMMAAMTQLGLVPKDRTTGAHMSAADIEHYLPILSDLAATYGSTAYGGQGVNLQQAAYAVRMSAEGMARMLKMDLNINPEELIHYGLKATGSGYAIHITDPSTLLPALEAFARAKGVSGGVNDINGASMMMEQGTFKGAFSSFVDRLQNFALEAGGTDLSGNIRQGSFFGRIKEDLNNVSGWMATHGDQVASLADHLQGLFGGGVTVAGGLLGGVFSGLSQSGAGNTLMDDLQRFSDFLHDPSTQDALHNFGAEVGSVFGPVLQTASQGVQGFFQGLGSSGAGQALKNVLDGLGKWFADPSHQQDIKNFTTQLGTLVGDIVTFTSQVLGAGANLVGGITSGLYNASNSGPGQYAISTIGQIMAHFASQSDLNQVWQAAITGKDNPFSAKNDAAQRDALLAYIEEYIMRQDAAKGYNDQQTQADINSILQYLQQLANGQGPQGAIPPRGKGGSTGVTPGTQTATTAAGRQRLWQDANTAHGAVGADWIDYLLSGQGSDTSTPALTQKGRDAGTAYLSGFQSAMQTSTTPTTAVNAYIAQFDAKIAQAGDPLAYAIAQYVNQKVQLEVANALRNYNGNGDLRQAGGYARAGGIGPGYR